MSAKDLVGEMEKLAAELRDKALALLETIQEPKVSDRKANSLLLNIFVDGVKVTRAVDRLTKKCQQYFRRLEAEKNEGL